MLSSMRACNAAAAEVLAALSSERFWRELLPRQRVFPAPEVPEPGRLAAAGARESTVARVCELAGVVRLAGGGVECVERIKFN